MKFGPRAAAVVVVVLVGCCLVGVQGSRYPSSGPGITLPFLCPHEVTLTKVRMQQGERMYVQYVEYDTPIPSLTSFTIHYWFNLANLVNTSTMFNYGLNPATSGDLLTVQLESHERGRYQYWVVDINGVEVSRVSASPLIRSGQWYHALHTWDSRSGVVSHFINGNLLRAESTYKGKGLIIPGGGEAVSGQHRSAIELFSGMDQGEGFNGWFTLFHLSSKSSSISSADAITKAKLASQCSSAADGDIINWNKTPRRAYGGLTETPSFSKACGRF